MAEQGRKLSQRDIARIAGVSQAAVSMVLNGKADEYQLAAATQERIRAAMTEYGYVPNINGRALRSGRNGLIGVHTYESVFPVAPDDYYHEFLVGIESAAVRARQDLVLFASTQGADGTRRIYGDGGNRLRLADGAVILGIEQNDDELERLALEGFPFVFVGHREVPGTAVPYVTADYARAVRERVQALVDVGHRAIGYLAPTRRPLPLRERYAGFRAIKTDLGLDGEEVFADPADISVGVVKSMLTSATAVVVETYEVGEALADAIDELGVVIPRDLSVLLLDTPSPRVEGWSHLVFPRREMGEKAVELLLMVLDGEIEGDHHESLSCQFVELGSTGAPAG